MSQVYKISIGAACNLSWPSDRLVIQVLDDSTDFVIKVQLIKANFTSLVLYLNSTTHQSRKKISIITHHIQPFLLIQIITPFFIFETEFGESVAIILLHVINQVKLLIWFSLLLIVFFHMNFLPKNPSEQFLIHII